MAFKLWAGQEILPGDPPTAVATATPSAITPGQIVKFDGSQSKDKDIKVTWQETKEGYKYNFQREEIDGVIKEWNWTFGDGGSGSGETTSHKYTEPGEYAVTLKITADHDETATITTSVTVYPPCPVCAKLEKDKAELEKQLLEKQKALKEIEDELREKYKRKIEIIQRQQEIREYLGGIGEERLESFFTPETNKWKLLLKWLKIPHQAIKDEKHLSKFFKEYGELSSEKKEIKDRIKELESQRDRLNGEIEKIEERIKEIEDEIANCKYPPTH